MSPVAMPAQEPSTQTGGDPYTIGGHNHRRSRDATGAGYDGWRWDDDHRGRVDRYAKANGDPDPAALAAAEPGWQQAVAQGEPTSRAYGACVT